MGGLFFHAKIFSPWANLRYKQAHKCMAKQRQTHSAVAHTKRVSCAHTPAQMPWSWAGTSLLPAEMSHFAEQTWIPALRHAAILHAEEKPRQKEGSLQFCTSLQIELKPKKSGGFLVIVEKILMPENVQKATAQWDFPTSRICRISGNNMQNRWKREQNVEQAKYAGYQVTDHMP